MKNQQHESSKRVYFHSWLKKKKYSGLTRKPPTGATARAGVVVFSGGRGSGRSGTDIRNNAVTDCSCFLVLSKKVSVQAAQMLFSSLYAAFSLSGFCPPRLQLHCLSLISCFRSFGSPAVAHNKAHAAAEAPARFHLPMNEEEEAGEGRGLICISVKEG